MDKKTCYKCNIIKPLSEFYKHKQMGDGHLNKCKVCTKIDVTIHRSENIEKCRAYDRWRYENHPHRAELAGKWQRENPERSKESKRLWSTSNRDKIKVSQSRWDKANPHKKKANRAVSNAIAGGRLTRPESCSRCLKLCKPEAHHWSYLEENWLDVIWLCRQCHVAEHKALREKGIIL